MHEFGLNYISPLNYSIFLPSSSNSGTKRLFGHTFLSLLTDKEKRSYCSMKLANAQKNTRGLERCVNQDTATLNSIFHFLTFSLLTFNFFIKTLPNTTEWEDEWIGKKEVIS